MIPFKLVHGLCKFPLISLQKFSCYKLESSNPTQLIAKIKHQAKAEMEFRWHKVTPFTIFGNESTVYHLLRTARQNLSLPQGYVTNFPVPTQPKKNQTFPFSRSHVCARELTIHVSRSSAIAYP